MNSLQTLWNLMSENNFEVENPCLNEDLICVICNKLMIDACHSVCGCRYCYKCISDYLGGMDNKFCPGGSAKCKEEYLILETDVVRDRRINNRVAKVKAKCPHDSCGSMIELSQMEDHLRLCAKQSSQCPFKAIGCDDDGEVKEAIIAHINSETFAHTQLLIEWIQNLKNEMDGMKVSFESRLLKMEEESKAKDNRINAMEQKLSQLQNEDQIDISVESEIVVKEASIQGSASSIGTPSNLKGSFIWRIEECSKKRGPTSYSDPFYICDYKFCLSMFLYGDSVGLNLVIMKGENDETLQWPMKKTVTISILDQVTMTAHKTETFHFDTFYNKNAFNRPLLDRTNYIGANPFIHYSAIKDRSSIIVNDSIVVSCALHDPHSSL